MVRLRLEAAGTPPTLASLLSPAQAAGGAWCACVAAAFAVRFPLQLGGLPGLLLAPGLTWTFPLAALLAVRPWAGGDGGRKKGAKAE